MIPWQTAQKSCYFLDQMNYCHACGIWIYRHTTQKKAIRVEFIWAFILLVSKKYLIASLVQNFLILLKEKKASNPSGSGALRGANWLRAIETGAIKLWFIWRVTFGVIVLMQQSTFSFKMKSLILFLKEFYYNDQK
jgi:hypothetical protein